MRVVVDTNVFISSFLGKGPPRKIIDLWKQGFITICLSMPIVEEYTEILARLGLSGTREIDEIIQLFVQGYNSIFIANPKEVNLIFNDKDDIKFFECAVSLKAEYIVSGDKEVLSVSNYFGIKTLSPSEFMKLFDK